MVGINEKLEKTEENYHSVYDDGLQYANDKETNIYINYNEYYIWFASCGYGYGYDTINSFFFGDDEVIDQLEDGGRDAEYCPHSSDIVFNGKHYSISDIRRDLIEHYYREYSNFKDLNKKVNIE